MCAKIMNERKKENKRYFSQHNIFFWNKSKPFSIIDDSKGSYAMFVKGMTPEKTNPVSTYSYIQAPACEAAFGKNNDFIVSIPKQTFYFYVSLLQSQTKLTRKAKLGTCKLYKKNIAMWILLRGCYM